MTIDMFIRQEKYESVAEQFLTELGFEEYISEPYPIPIYDIATEKLSLSINRAGSLSLDESKRCFLVLNQGKVDLYDRKSGIKSAYEVNQPTVFIDPSIVNKEELGLIFTYACYYIWAYNDFFDDAHEIKTIEKGEVICVPIDFSSGLLTHDVLPNKTTQLDFIKYTASFVVPRILMPRRSIKKKIDDYFNGNVPYLNNSETDVVWNSFVNSLSEYFIVPLSTVIDRLQSLGYSEIQPCSAENSTPNQKDRKKAEQISIKHYQPISIIDAFELYLNDVRFRQTFNTGVYSYVDGYFVLNNENYITFDMDHRPILTDYARTRLEECVLDVSIIEIGRSYLVQSADLKTVHSIIKKENVIALFLDSEISKIIEEAYKFRDDYKNYKSKDNDEDCSENRDIARAFRAFLEKFKKKEHNKPVFVDMIKKRIEEKNWSPEDFEDNTQLSPSVYKKIMKSSSNEDISFKKETLLILCYTLGFSCSETNDILIDAGYVLKSHELITALFLGLIVFVQPPNIEFADRLAKEYGLPPLIKVYKNPN